MNRLVVLKQNPEMIPADMNGEVVMMDAAGGMYYNLGKTGGRIWNLLEKGLTVEDLVRALVEIYDVEFEQCLLDIEPFINKMLARGLLLAEDER